MEDPKCPFCLKLTDYSCDVPVTLMNCENEWEPGCPSHITMDNDNK